jgi:hypothetical protein
LPERIGGNMSKLTEALDCIKSLEKTEQSEGPVERVVNCLFCQHCKEDYCTCAADDTCKMIRQYLILKEFHSSVGCLFAEGVEFMSKVEIYEAIKKDFYKTMPVYSVGS